MPSVVPSQLRIVTHPAAVLRAKAAAVPDVSAEVAAVAERMIAIMFELDGVGLAAPQVGLSWRMFVAHVPEDPEQERFVSPPPPGLPSATAAPEVYINPVLSRPEGVPEPYSEGCLSLPDIRGDVLRPPVITIEATGLDGKRFSRRASGLLARCWQHEVDHLDGVLILDKMVQRDRLKNRAAVRELERRET